MIAFAADMDRRCQELDFDKGLTDSAAVLTPKSHGAFSLDMFRPLACLVTMRKLLGYLWLASLPSLCFQTFQTAFVKGTHAMHGVFALLKAAELSKQWGEPLYVAQLDLKKAFDHVDRGAAIDALKLQGASLHTIAWITQLWDSHSLEMRMGSITTERFETTRGLPQGAPESPVVFTLIAEMVMRKLNGKWAQRQDHKVGFKIDSWWLPSLAYADDIILLARSKAALEYMIVEASEAFAEVGLEVGHAKTNWSSCPPAPGTMLTAGPVQVQWAKTLRFVGVEIDLQGNSASAITHRMAQAQSTYGRWHSILLCPWIAPTRRCFLLIISVWNSFLWGAACWHPTKAMRNKLSSWGARTMATVAGTRRSPTEDIGQWWRRLHRSGHCVLQRHGADPEVARRKVLHRWAGHVARMPHNAQPAQALRTRSLQWWRHAQSNHTDKKWTGVHKQRFGCWRWESQISEVHGEGYSSNIGDNTGWLLKAQCRDSWRLAEAGFAAQRGH